MKEASYSVVEYALFGCPYCEYEHEINYGDFVFFDIYSEPYKCEGCGEEFSFGEVDDELEAF